MPVCGCVWGGDGVWVMCLWILAEGRGFQSGDPMSNRTVQLFLRFFLPRFASWAPW